jgi:hypothetical protein
MKQWVRVVPNMSLGAYEITAAAVPIPDPEWPTMKMRDILQVAFKHRLIEGVGHPVVQRLRGLS